MTAPSSIDPARFLHEQLAQASPDLLRQMLTTFINTLMSAEADAEYGTRSAERTNVRNGYRSPGSSTPAPARWRWRSPGSVPARTSPTGYLSAAGVRSGR